MSTQLLDQPTLSTNKTSQHLCTACCWYLHLAIQRHTHDTRRRRLHVHTSSVTYCLSVSKIFTAQRLCQCLQCTYAVHTIHALQSSQPHSIKLRMHDRHKQHITAAPNNSKERPVVPRQASMTHAQSSRKRFVGKHLLGRSALRQFCQPSLDPRGSTNAVQLSFRCCLPHAQWCWKHG